MHEMPDGERQPAMLALIFACAILAPNPGDASEEEYPLEPADRTSPRATLQTFLHNSKESWELFLESGKHMEIPRDQTLRALRCLDLGHVPPAQQADVGFEAGLLLFDVLNRIELPPLDQVPGEADSDSNARNEWTIPHTPITIARAETGPQAGEWLFSRGTVKRAKEMYRQTRALPLNPGAVVEDGYRLYISAPGPWIPINWVTSLPEAAHKMYLEQTLWQWIAAVVVLLSFILMAQAARRAYRLPPSGESTRVLPALVFPLALMLLAAGSGYFLHKQINLTGGVLNISGIFFDAVFFVGAILGVSRLGRILAQTVIRLKHFEDDQLQAGFVSLSVRLAAGIGILVLIGLWAYSLGLPVLGVLTGLGVGGIAVALAAKPTLENFIGSMTLFADRPVRIGDFCVFGDKSGTVEHIGLRSTRLRTPERSVLTVPNAEFSRVQIENLAERDRRRFTTKLSLFLETTAAQIEAVRAQVLELLGNDNRVIDRGARIELVAIGPLSIDLELSCFIRTRDHAEFLAIRRELLLKIIHIIEDAGTSLAAPGQTQYLRESRAGSSGVLGPSAD